MEKTDDNLHEIIKEQCSQLTIRLETYMKELSESIEAERREFYAPRIEELEARLQEQTRQNDKMSEENDELTAELVRKEAILTRLCNLSAKLHQRVRNGNGYSRVFNLWTEMGADRRILYRTFKRIFIKQAMKRVLFRRWNRRMHRKREYQVLQGIRSKFDKETKTKSNESDKLIKQLEMELAQAKAELEEKQEKFVNMQQRLRKAFMRGVVNLNLEAMEVFNGAQFMDLVKEVDGREADIVHEMEANDDDEDLFVEEKPQISVVRHF